MYNDRNNPVTSRASEAIVSEDGRVRRRLNNYETTIGANSNNNIFIPSGAVNDNYGNLKNFKMPPVSPSPQTVNPKLSRYRLISIVGTVVLIGSFLWSITFFVEPGIKKLQDNSGSETNANHEDMAVDHLEKIANLIISDGKWNKPRIDSFMDSWTNISKDRREKFKSQAWFQQFSYRLQGKIKRERLIGAYSGSKDKDRKKAYPYIMLADAIGLSDKNVSYMGSTSKHDIDQIYSKLAKEVEEELVKLEKNKIKADEDANKAQTKNNKDDFSTTESVAKNNTEISDNLKENPADTQSHQSDKMTISDVKKDITGDDVKTVLDKYSKAYQSGNINEITSLFGVNETAENQQVIAKLKSNYENIFKSSGKRTLIFGDVNWNIHDGIANVDSEYIAQAELEGGKGIKTVSGTARLKINKNNNEVNIANFELLNRKESIIKPVTLSSVENHRIEFKAKRPKGPTPAELQDLVTRMISSYESGDLNTFGSLFAKNAKTNDRNDLESIKKDYKKLFETSNDRQMFIKGLRWKREADYAQGRGDLEAMILMKPGESVYTMSGKIEIVVKRIDGKVLITRLYHLERAK